MIYDRCPRCRRRIPAGTKCNCCQPERRVYPKKDNTDQYASFYNSVQWQRARAEAKNKYNNLDLYSLYILNRIEQADTVHHIEPVKEAWDKRYSIENLIPLTGRNHQLIHKKMEDEVDMADLLKRLKARYDKEFGISGQL